MPRPPRFPHSDHCDGRRFFNPHRSTDKSFLEVVRCFWRAEWPEWPMDIRDPPHPTPRPPAPGGVSVTHIGHATFLIQLDGLALITDPVFSRRASPFSFYGPSRARPPGVRLEDLPKLDAVLLSHGHYDHADAPSLRTLARRFAPRAVTGLNQGALLDRCGLRAVDELDWWEAAELPGDVRVTFVPAQHWTSRVPFRRNEALWGGFVVEGPSATVYFCGDSGYGPHFRQIAERFPGIDVALLPIGAFLPRWFMEPQHMDPSDAVQAHRDLSPTVAFAMHYGVFRLTPETIDAPVEGLHAARAAAGLTEDSFRTLGFGETATVYPERMGRLAPEPAQRNLVKATQEGGQP